MPKLFVDLMWEALFTSSPEAQQERGTIKRRKHWLLNVIWVIVTEEGLALSPFSSCAPSSSVSALFFVPLP